ncbi:(d)CMP kinase [Aquibacillus rhizosphaerae]|uniref:Cytidylate kinase n=1 Tax=Aquibacillus rhizosphaerae TaxID=3051431 RepID=A0ABT7L6E6_9BACI|nr:(d)CMP kinase [Aquibacillus sp. LR5S19]MDL4840785.1 (d)CMP kinase [Aquibacillus sp. LR5S19]
MVTNKIAIAIDGPAAAGKSTVAKKVARYLEYIYIDTGAMYRSLTYKALQKEIDLENENKLFELLKQTTIDLKQGKESQKVFLDGEDVTTDIRTDVVTNNVSVVAKHSSVRKEMVARQQFLAQKRQVVMDGRDIGTHVIPNAEVKIFLIASVEERALRRHKENIDKGYPSELEKLKKEIEKRDQLDSEREAAPLIKADDAIEIDTTSLSIDDVVDRILGVVEKVKGRLTDESI